MPLVKNIVKMSLNGLNIITNLGIAGRKRTSSRQEDEKGVAMHSKDSELYWLGLDHHDGFILNREHPLLTDFADYSLESLRSI